MDKVWKELFVTFWLAFLGAMIWVTVILKDGMIPPDEVIVSMSKHLESYGAWFFIIDLLVGILLLRWSWLWWRAKARFEAID